MFASVQAHAQSLLGATSDSLNLLPKRSNEACISSRDRDPLPVSTVLEYPLSYFIAYDWEKTEMEGQRCINAFHVLYRYLIGTVSVHGSESFFDFVHKHLLRHASQMTDKENV